MRGGSRQQGAGAVGADGLRLIEMRGPLNTVGSWALPRARAQVPVSSHQQTVLIIVVFIIRVYPV